MLTQCQRPEEAQAPDQLLTKERMVQLLIQVHLNEARVEASRLSADSSRALYNKLHQELLWNKEVTDSVFRASYHYYAVHGKDLEEIYTTVVDSLAMREVKMTGQPKP
nr:DUF4296 domain-containing protein [Hymenobacter translucens]